MIARAKKYLLLPKLLQVKISNSGTAWNMSGPKRAGMFAQFFRLNKLKTAAMIVRPSWLLLPQTNQAARRLHHSHFHSLGLSKQIPYTVSSSWESTSHHILQLRSLLSDHHPSLLDQPLRHRSPEPPRRHPLPPHSVTDKLSQQGNARHPSCRERDTSSAFAQIVGAFDVF